MPQRLLLSTRLTLMCVCGTWTHIVCVDKVHFPSSPHSVVSRARLSRGGSESLACKTTRLAQCKTFLLLYLHPDSTVIMIKSANTWTLVSTMKLLRGNLIAYTRTPPYHDIRQVRECPDSTISKVSTVLKWRMITTLNRKLLEKQRV